jgi:hypothetical protein
MSIVGIPEEWTMRFLTTVTMSLVTAAACGGGGNNPPPVIIDSPPPPPDAAPAACPANAGMLSLGTDAAPVENEWFFTPMTGPNTGMKTFEVGGTLPGGSTKDVLIAQFVMPFTTGVARTFQTDATSTASFTAQSLIFGNFNATAMTVDHLMFAGSGSITLTQVGEAATQITKGNVTATAYREIDGMTNADVAGGCSTMLGGLTFVLKEKPAPFQDEDGPVGKAPNAEMEAARHLFHQQLGQE